MEDGRERGDLIGCGGRWKRNGDLISKERKMKEKEGI